MLILDFETFSRENIRRVGLQRYARHAEVMLTAYRIGLDGETKLWDATDGSPMPAELRDALCDDDVRCLAHNAPFERAVLLHYFDIDVPWHRWEDTMVLALTAGLPGAMELLCDALGWGEEIGKLRDGKRLIDLFCKPAPKNHKRSRYDKTTHPEEWQRFGEYCMRDVDVCVELWQHLPHWTYDTERECWRLDARINERGVPIDMMLAEAAVAAAGKLTEACNARMAELTGGAVKTVGSTVALAEWLGVESVSKAELQRVRGQWEPGTPQREAVELRLRAGKASMAKYNAALRTQVAGRIYNSLQFYGAFRTGRWAGRGVQPQNMLRPSAAIAAEMDIAIAAIKRGVVGLVYEDEFDVLASCTRSVFGIDEGAPRKLVVSDLSNIEGRMLAALAGEEWKLQAFRDQDAGGDDVYRMSYARSFNVDVASVTKAQRQIGKVQELALGYQGGPAAYVSMGANYGIDPQDLVTPVRDAVDEETWRKAGERYRRRKARGLTLDQFAALTIIVDAWREAHPCTRQFWWNLEGAAIAAVESFIDAKERGKHHGDVMATGPLRWLCTEHNGRTYLLCRLPSGRRLCYYGPHLEETTITYVDRKTGEDKTITKHGLRYWGQHNRKWVREATYGGKLAENLTQAASRDVMAHGMQLAEDHGYPCVLTVHDETVTETPDHPLYTAEELSELLATRPQWVVDLNLPLNAAGYESRYYRKD